MSKKLPKEYLSWSQINCVESNPDDYVRQYIDGDSFEGNVYTDFGSYIHKNIEKGRRPKKIPNLILYPEGEVEKYLTIKRGDEEVVLYGFFDGLDRKKHVIGEYKTASQLWSDNKVRKHGQLILYSLMYWRETGVIPTCTLTSMETKFSDHTGKKLRLTGRHSVCSVKYSEEELLDMESRVWKAYDKIVELMSMYN